MSFTTTSSGARIRKSGIRRAHFEFGTFRQDASDEQESKGRGNDTLKARMIEALMFSLALLALGCESDKLFRITSDVKINANPDFMKSLGANGKTIAGQLHYQACDKTTCYLPTSIPVAWQVEILPLDRQRSPEAIQHK